MPELPEVETIVRQLQPVITGKTLKGLQVFWPKTICEETSPFSKNVIGQEIAAVLRRGKYICIRLKNDSWLTIHLRMTGKILIGKPPGKAKHIRVVFKLSDNCQLTFIDCRKFGRIKRWPVGEKVLPQLGPEPLDEQTVFTALKTKSSRRAIKTILLDQNVLAGIGNIYADEGLFTAGIHPQTPLDSILLVRLEQLSRAIPSILNAAITNQGTTLSNYRSPQNKKGRNQYFLKVYGQTDKPCLQCQTPIKKIKINGRGSHFCPSCQAR